MAEPAWNGNIDIDGIEAFGAYHEAVLAFGRRLAAAGPRLAMDEVERLIVVCPAFAESCAEMVDDICLFLMAETDHSALPRPEAYEAFPTYEEAVVAFARNLLREYPEPNDAIHEIEQVAIIFPTLAECLAELLGALRFSLWSYGMGHPETELYRDAEERSSDGSHRYDGTDPDIPF